MTPSSIVSTGIHKADEKGCAKTNDFLAVEEPLEMRIRYGSITDKVTKNISVTMRTPGNDEELVTGFLFTEGIIKSVDEINNVKHIVSTNDNVIEVELKPGVSIDLKNLERNSYTTSSCGVCGKSSIEAIKTRRSIDSSDTDDFECPSSIIYTLPAVLKSAQNIFTQTGGLHASGLFKLNGDLLLSREDVGRHNALDKLIGASLKQNLFPLHKFLLLLSGRASFELVQKAHMAGIRFIAAVGAPSSLAVQTAEDFGITLLGFVKTQTFNIYSAAQRIKIPAYETSYQG